MLKTTTQEFREFFLLEFTRELVNSFAPKEIVKLNIIADEEKKTKQEEIKQQVQEKFSEEKIQISRPLIPQRIIPPRRIFFQPKPFLTNLVKETLPERLRYLKPTPREVNLNLGKLNFILKDPQVSSIECNGEGKRIIVNLQSPKTTDIILTKEDIEETLKEFSRVSKIPIENGIMRIAAGKLILMAVVSQMVPTKFIIKKIPVPQRFY